MKIFKVLLCMLEGWQTPRIQAWNLAVDQASNVYNVYAVWRIFASCDASTCKLRGRRSIQPS